MVSAPPGLDVPTFPGGADPAAGAPRQCPEAAGARPGLGGLWLTSCLWGSPLGAAGSKARGASTLGSPSSRPPTSPRLLLRSGPPGPPGGANGRAPGPLPARPDPHLGHLRPEVDVLEVDGAGAEVVQQLAQQDAVAQRLGQVEDHGRGPDDAVVGRQDPAVDEPAAALPPLLHGARARRAGQLRAALRPKCGGRGASRPPARGSAAGAGLRAGGPGGPRRAAARPLRLRLLGSSPTCGRGAGAGQPAGSPLQTRKSLQAPGRAPRSPPPQRPSIRAARRLILRSGRPAAAAAPAPPETKARRVARSARPGPGPPSPPPLCSPRLRVQRAVPGYPTLQLGGSGVQGGGGAARGGGRRQARPRPLAAHFLPRGRAPKLRRAGAAARPRPQARGLSPRGSRTLGNLCAPGARPRLWSDGRSWSLRPSCVSGGAREVALVALGASARSFAQDRPWRGHRLGGLVRRPLGPRSGPGGELEAGGTRARDSPRAPSCPVPWAGTRRKAPDRAQRPGFPCSVTQRPATGSCPEGKPWRRRWNTRHSRWERGEGTQPDPALAGAASALAAGSPDPALNSFLGHALWGGEWVGCVPSSWPPAKVGGLLGRKSGSERMRILAQLSGDPFSAG